MPETTMPLVRPTYAELVRENEDLKASQEFLKAGLHAMAARITRLEAWKAEALSFPPEP